MTDCRLHHLGFPPASSAEWQAYRADEHEAFLDSLDRRQEPLPPDYSVTLEPGEEPEQDPVTDYDMALWSSQAHHARLEFQDTIWQRSWDEIRAYWDEMSAEVNAKAFTKRFEVWCEKGCPLDTQEGHKE